MSVVFEHSKNFKPVERENIEDMIQDILSDPRVKKMRDFLSQVTDSTDDQGRPDLEKIISNGTYNIDASITGDITILILQEKIKLANLKSVYAKKKHAVYLEKQNSRYGFVPSNEGMRIMVDGDDTIADLNCKIERQELYIEFLEKCEKRVIAYKYGTDSIVEAAKLGKDTGKILCL